MGLLTRISGLFCRSSCSFTAVKDVLTGLPRDCEVIADIQYDTSSIDYTIFTRLQGIFAIKALPDRGKVSYDDKTLLVGGSPRSDIIKGSLRDTFFIKSIVREQVGVDAYVTSIVCFEKAALREAGSILGVLLVSPAHLRESVLHAPERAALPDGVLMCLRDVQMRRMPFLRR